MELTSVHQAAPLLAGSFALLFVGLLCPARIGGFITRLSGALIFVWLLCAGCWAGLGVAIQTWETHPEYAWMVFVCAAGLAYWVTEQRKRKPFVPDDDDDDDGGLRLHAPEPPEPTAPPPDVVPDLPPSPDWDDFDDARRDWEREPATV